MIWINIDRSVEVPLIRQVYEQIRQQILRGELKSGERLPSSRELASNLEVSRNVIIDAYEQLHAEGYIEGLHGSGTFVAQGTYLEQDTRQENVSYQQKSKTNDKNSENINFRSGIPALELFPRKIWGNLAKKVCIDTTHSTFGYDFPEGRLELRHVLSRYLKRTRGVQCNPDQIVITSGATQGLSLVARLLLSEGDEVIIEDPITHEIQTFFTPPGCSLYPIPVDEYGMRTDLIPKNKIPSFIFVTPSHQFPLGGTLPIQRRIQLIQFARDADCHIVEDDYDSEFRYSGPPISSLQGLDPTRVIYIGTFSKILSPALRLGYLILPPSLVESCKKLKWFTDLHTSSLDQLTLAQFIEEGYLERHIRKMKKVYRKRRDTLIKSLNETFRNDIKIHGDSTGLHLIVEFKNIHFSRSILNKINDHNVQLYPVEIHTIRKNTHNNKIILGYGNLSESEIKEGIKRMKDALDSSDS